MAPSGTLCSLGCREACCCVGGDLHTQARAQLSPTLGLIWMGQRCCQASSCSLAGSLSKTLQAPEDQLCTSAAGRPGLLAQQTQGACQERRVSGGEGGPGGCSADRSPMLKAARFMPLRCRPAAFAAAMITWRRSSAVGRAQPAGDSLGCRCRCAGAGCRCQLLRLDVGSRGARLLVVGELCGHGVRQTRVPAGQVVEEALLFRCQAAGRASGPRIRKPTPHPGPRPEAGRRPARTGPQKQRPSLWQAPLALAGQQPGLLQGAARSAVPQVHLRAAGYPTRSRCPAPAPASPGWHSQSSCPCSSPPAWRAPQAGRGPSWRGSHGSPAACPVHRPKLSRSARRATGSP